MAETIKDLYNLNYSKNFNILDTEKKEIDL